MIWWLIYVRILLENEIKQKKKYRKKLNCNILFDTIDHE